MTNSLSNQGFQISNYLSQAFDLEEEFNRNSKTQDLRRLQQMHQQAHFLETIGKRFIEFVTDIDESNQDFLLETLGKVISIAENLAARIQAVPPAAIAVFTPISSPTEVLRRNLQRLSNLIVAINKQKPIIEIDDLYYQLPPKPRKDIFANLWRVRGCPTAESPIPSIKDLAHEHFGEVSFFDMEPRCVSTPLQKRLALELSITPSLILEQMMEFISVDEFEKALILFDLLPEKIQETAFKNLWASLGLEVIHQDKESNKELFSNFLTRRTLPRTAKNTLILSLKKAATESEEAVNSLVDSRQKEFLDTTALALGPEMSAEEVEILQNLLFHDIAEELTGILDTKPFVRSPQVILEEILIDYHERYPSLLRSRILFLFCSSAFTRYVAPFFSENFFMTSSPTMVAAATASAAGRILGGSIGLTGGATVRDVNIEGYYVMMPPPSPSDIAETPIEHPAVARVKAEIKSEKDSWVVVDGGVDSQPFLAAHTTGTGLPTNPAIKKAHLPLMHDQTPRLSWTSPRDSIIDICPKILRDCPKELTQLVADSIMKDWEVTSFITSEGVYLTDAPAYHLEMVTWEINSQVRNLKKFIKTLQSNPKADDLIDLIEILEVKQKHLHEIYLKVMEDTLTRFLSYEAEIFSRLPHPLYERALVLSRIDFYAEALKKLQDTNPKSEMIAKVQDKMEEYQKHLQTLPPYDSQKELLEEGGFIEMYENNLLLANFWLLPILPDVLHKITWSNAREAFAQNLKEAISGIKEDIGKAKTYLSYMPEEGKMGTIIREIQTLEENLTRVKAVYEQLSEIATVGKIENNRNLVEKVSTSPTDRDVVETIKSKIG